MTKAKRRTSRKLAPYKITQSNYTKDIKPRKKEPLHTELKKKTLPNRKENKHYPTIYQYFLNHSRSFFGSLGQLSNIPFSTFLTSMVVAIALALPTGLFILLNDIKQLSNQWNTGNQISLYLKQNSSEAAISEFSRHLRQHALIDTVTYISKQQALDEFRQFSGFGKALDFIDENPLPSVLIVKPKSSSSTAEVERLFNELKSAGLVEVAQIDLLWLKRLNAMIETGQRGILMLAVILGLAIFVITGNTIRLIVQNKQKEIEITKMMGATNGFVRRPFLYTGFWYGVFGSTIAALFIWLFFWFLNDPIITLSSLYNNQFELTGIKVSHYLAMFSIGIGVCLIGSWITLERFLRRIDMT